MATFYQSLLAQYLSTGFRTIVQIGANDGMINDPIYQCVTANQHRNRILLIEPQENVIDALKTNYKTHPNSRILNCAVGAEPRLQLYRLKPELYESFQRRYLLDSPSYRVPTGFTSFSRQHVINHIAGNLPDHIACDDAIDVIDVACMTLINALKTIGWEPDQVDVLQIDAEGGDYQVLQSCNLEIVRPTLLNFEHNHLSIDDYNRLVGWLGSLGYAIYRHSASDTMATLLNISFQR
jgi:FkbM family methyltransferase